MKIFLGKYKRELQYLKVWNFVPSKLNIRHDQ